MLLNPSSPVANEQDLLLSIDVPLSIDEPRRKFLQFLTESFNDLLHTETALNDIKQRTSSL